MEKTITLYRVGDIENIKQGLFFADNLSYYKNSDTNYDETDDVFNEYIIYNPNIIINKR